MDRITSPFGAYTTAREVAAGHDLSGRTVIVTGGATGIGIETARALAEQGASTSVWAAVGDELEGKGGLYLENCAQAVPWNADQPWAGVMPHALDKAAADRLWALSQETTGA